MPNPPWSQKRTPDPPWDVAAPEISQPISRQFTDVAAPSDFLLRSAALMNLQNQMVGQAEQTPQPIQPEPAMSLGTPEAQTLGMPEQPAGIREIGSEYGMTPPGLGARVPQGMMERAEAGVGGFATGFLGEFDPNTQSIVGRMAGKYDPNLAQTGGEFAGIGASFMPVVGAVGKVGQIPRLARLGAKVPAMARYAARGAVEGGVWGAGREGMRVAGGEEFDPMRMAEEAAYGAVGDVAIRGLGRYVAKPIMKALRGAPEPSMAGLGRIAPEYARTAPEGLQRKARPRAEWRERVKYKPSAESFISHVESHITPQGGLQRGLDYYNDFLKQMPDVELSKVMGWAEKHQTPYVRRRLGSNIDAEIRLRSKDGKPKPKEVSDAGRLPKSQEVGPPRPPELVTGKGRRGRVKDLEQRQGRDRADRRQGATQKEVAGDIFIRKATKKEVGSVRSRALGSLPKKEGYEPVYKPYGNTGQRADAGFYYTPARVMEQPRIATETRGLSQLEKDYPDLAKKATKPTKAVTLPRESKRKVKAPVAGGIAAQPPVKVQPVKTPPPKKPAVKVAVATPEPKKPAIVLTKAESVRVRKAFDLDKLPDAERKPIEESLNQAKRDKHDITAFETATEVVSNPRPLSDAEQAGISLKVTELAEQRDVITKQVSDLTERGDGWAAKKARERADAIDAQVDVLTAAYDYGGTELGRAMNLRKFGIDRESMKLTAVLQRGREAHGGKLKGKATQEFERLTSRHSKIEKELMDMRVKHGKMAPEYERLLAEKVTRIENQRAAQNKRTIKKRKSIYAERDDIKKQLVGLGFQVKDVTGLTTEGSYLVGKLANTYIQEGAITLNGVVRRIMADLPNVNERDVYQSLVARAPKTQAKAMSEAQQRVLRLKRQARLLVDIENAEKGLFQKRGVGKKSARPEIKVLQKQLAQLRKSAWASGIESKKLERAMNTLDELQDQLGSHYKDLKKTPLDRGSIESVRTKLKQVRRALRVDEDLTSLNKQLDSGDFIIKERPVAKKLPVELERKELELIRARKDIRAAIRNLQPMTTRQKIGEGFNFLRTMKATSDLSATLRQSLALSARRPVTAVKVFGRSLKAFGSTYKAEQIDRAIRAHPNHYLREKAGLFLAEFEGVRLTAREEMFMSNWAHKIPGYGRLVKASDRHMVSHINLMRASAFDQFMDAVPNATTKEMKAWADFVNVASGRGNLSVGKAGEALSAVLFAPRFAWSRVEYPFMLKKHWSNPRVRKEIAKDQVAMAGLFASTLTLASLAGAEVELNPRGSDFGKIKVGDTRYDIAAGFLQPMRYLLRFPARGLDVMGVTGKHLPESEKKFLPMDDILRLISYKAAPSVTLTDALIRGKFSFGGGEVTPVNVAYRGFSPIVAEAIYDAWRDRESPAKLASIALGEGLGLGVTSYRRKSKKVDVR